MNLLKQQQFGFTLVEMLVAMAIGASISVLAYRTLDGVIRAEEKVADVTRQVDAVDRVWQALSNDLAYARERLWVDPFGQQQSALVGVFGDRLSQSEVLVANENDYLLKFIRDNRSNVLNRPRSSLMIVGYRLTADENSQTTSLWRDSWAPVDAAGEPQVQQRLLISGIQKLGFKYCSRETRLPGNCATGWPVGTERLSASLPAAVEVQLSTSRLGDVTRLFALPVPLP